MDKKRYQILPGDGYITLRLIGILEAAHLSTIDQELQNVLIDPYPHVVVNCEHVTSLSKEWLRILLKTQLTLKEFNKSMLLILVNPQLMNALKREGVDTAFKYSKNLREALVEFGLVTKKMLDTDFVNPFLAAALHVLSVQANVTAQAQKIYLKNASDQLYGDVSGIIGVVSETFNGSVVISFPESTFLKVMSGMLGEECLELNKEIIDGAGEITNMIFGQAKIVLNEKGYGIKTAIPSVISGKEHSLSALTKGPIVVVPFQSNAGEFFIEICVST
jgi:chemotaxis protein CheX